MIEIFELSVNTKLHILMQNDIAQLADFRIFFRSTNELNESIQKDKKLAVVNTNKSPDLIVPQLPADRTESVIHGYSQSEREDGDVISACADGCACKLDFIKNTISESFNIVNVSQSGALKDRRTALHDLKYVSGNAVWGFIRFKSLAV